MAVVILGPEDYCREIEAYLCRKNDGHLIRIVGPAFEQVCGWAARGVPVKVAFRGIDRYFERYYAKGPRRRPVRVEFCEADVLDVFDEWRRAVGIATVGPVLLDRPNSVVPDPPGSAISNKPNSAIADQPKRPSRRPESLASHLERVIARLTSLRAGADRTLDEALDGVVRELDAARGSAKKLRGESRQRLIDRLRALDTSVLDAARDRCDRETLSRLSFEAEAELAPFRERMPKDTFDRSLHACVDRLLRERMRLPVIAYDG